VGSDRAPLSGTASLGAGTASGDKGKGDRRVMEVV